MSRSPSTQSWREIKNVTVFFELFLACTEKIMKSMFCVWRDNSSEVVHERTRPLCGRQFPLAKIITSTVGRSPFPLAIYGEGGGPTGRGEAFPHSPNQSRPQSRASIPPRQNYHICRRQKSIPPRQNYHICRRQKSIPPRHLWRGSGRQAGGEVTRAWGGGPNRKKNHFRKKTS